MPTLLTMFFLGAVALMTALYVPEQEARAEVALADVAATSMLAYREAVSDYLNANPSFTGTAPDASLTFTWGYVRDPRWTHVVESGGALYVYEATAGSSAAQTLDRLYRKTNASFMVGRNVGGQLVSANGFASGIAVPAAVPAGAITIVGR